MTALLLVLSLLQENEAPEIRGGGKGVAMDYGPFLSSSVSKGRYRTDADLLAQKGISIRLGPDATYCFDPDLLRAAGGWTGGFLDLSGTHLTSYKGSQPTRIQGTQAFETPRMAGVFAGDRPPPVPAYGPLPAAAGRYEGLYRHGNTVVLSYRAGDRAVLEYPGFAGGTFTRTFRILEGKEPLTIVVGKGGELRVGTFGPGAERVSIGLLDDLRVVRIPASDAPLRFTIAFRNGADPSAPRDPMPDPGTLVTGGPTRWKEILPTRGLLGKGEAAYLVDTLPAPEKNPWESWLRFTGMDFLPDGRAALCTWNGDVWILSGIDPGLTSLAWKRFASGLYEPLGLVVVAGTVHVLGRDQITRLRDLDGDGEADAYENFWNGLATVGNYHAFAFELHADREGRLYCITDGQRVDPDVPLHGCLVRIAADGRSHEVLATGLRAANGMSVGPDGEITISDNQGNWIPSSRLNFVRPGGFYGFVPHSQRPEPPKEQDAPLCWIPMGMDNSSGGQVWVTSDAWGPLKGSLLHLSYGTCSLFLVPFERLGAGAQGGVHRLPLSFNSGIMRGRFNAKDGQLYLAGLKGWQTTGTRDAGLFRVRYTGKPVALPRGVKILPDGVELEFTAPLDREIAASPDEWAVTRWNYRWTEKYGSADFSVSRPDKQGRDPVEVKAVRLSEDGRKAALTLDPFGPAMQLLIKSRLRSADGIPIPLELPLTVNRLP